MIYYFQELTLKKNKKSDNEYNKLKSKLAILQNKLKTEKDVFLRVGIKNEIEDIQASLFDLRDKEGKK